jgi:hypothetical protein
LNEEKRPETVADRLAALIDRVGGIPAAVRITGVSRAQMHRYRRGETDAPLPVVAALARSAGASLDWLAEGDDLRMVSLDVVEEALAAVLAAADAVGSTRPRPGTVARITAIIARHLTRDAALGRPMSPEEVSRSAAGLVGLALSAADTGDG